MVLIQFVLSNFESEGVVNKNLFILIGSMGQTMGLAVGMLSAEDLVLWDRDDAVMVLFVTYLKELIVTLLCHCI
jgi:hypothetical protein